MHKYRLFIFLAAVVFYGMAPSVVFGETVALQDTASSSDTAFERTLEAVLYNTETIALARQKHLLQQKSTGGPMLADNDPDGLGTIVGRGRGPSIARGVDSEEDKAPPSMGPMLAMDTSEMEERESPGPVLAQREDADSPMLATQDDPGGPSVDRPAESRPEEPRRDEPPEPPAEISADQEALYQEVRELREMVDQLRQEAEVREQLRVTEEEERDEEEEILQAAGREYSIRPPWQFQLDLRVNYNYNDYDVIRELQAREGTRIEHVANHRLTNTFSIETGVRDNLSIDASLPFVYVYDRAGTRQSRDTSNLGDTSVGFKYQPFRTGRGYPSPIFSVDYTFPTGSSPFEINQATELSTGSGFHAVSGRISMSHPFDPVNAFANLSYRHRFKETNIGQRRGRGTLDEVDPGESISVGAGFGYAVSYRMSMSLSLSCSYAFSTDYYWLAREGRDKTSSGDSFSASLSLSTSWRVTPRRRVIIGLGKGLTTANPGFTFTARMPIILDLR